MVNALLGSGSDGMNPAVAELLQKKLTMQLFGIEEDEEPIQKDGHLIGTGVESEYFGVLALRLRGATMTSPKVILELSTSGRLSVKPDELEAAGKWLIEQAKAYKPEYNKAVEASKSLALWELIGAGGD